MSGLGHRSGGGSGRWRALAAILSLYGLLLQAFLVGLNPVPVAAAAGILCPSHPDQAGADGLAHAHACCMPACPDPFAPPAPAATQAWPTRTATGSAWRVAASAPVRGPPARPASARGPPVA